MKRVCAVLMPGLTRAAACINLARVSWILLEFWDQYRSPNRSRWVRLSVQRLQGQELPSARLKLDSFAQAPLWSNAVHLFVVMPSLSSRHHYVKLNMSVGKVWPPIVRCGRSPPQKNFQREWNLDSGKKQNFIH